LKAIEHDAFIVFKGKEEGVPTGPDSLNSQFKAQKRFSIARARAQQHQIAWTKLRQHFACGPMSGRRCREMAPGSEALIPRKLIKCRMKRYVGFARTQLGLAFQSKDWSR
jgi:hypothetical protein